MRADGVLRRIKDKIKDRLGITAIWGAINALDERQSKLDERQSELDGAAGELWQRLFAMADTLIPIENIDATVKETAASDYWTRHTVYDGGFYSAGQSARYCEERFAMYPQFRDYIRADESHDGEVLLDYGCGPGNDMTWFSLNNDLKQLIGMDVSVTSLRKAQFRLALHDVPRERARLIKVDDASPHIPLPDDSVDHINCQGVLMHTSYPERILAEFRRVLKDNGKGCFMVYNKSSVWYHLYAAYALRFVDALPLTPLTQKEVAAMDVDEIFRRSTDGVDCPIARCYTPEEFERMCREAGFTNVEYMGGYTNSLEPGIAKKYLNAALKDERLEEEHKAFLREIVTDKDGYPVLRDTGMQCSIGGVYHVR